MPPRLARNSVIAINPSEYQLQCEWLECNSVFDSIHKLTLHLNEHLAEYITARNKTEEGNKNLPCQWRECNTDVEGGINDFLRHVYFHSFHVKIKCIGDLLLEKSGHLPCTLDKQSRNLIPELPECLECGWEHCHHRYENAEVFYRHVEMHADNNPEGNHVKNGCKCYWEGCETVVKSRHKLKDHLRSHTQEKLVACPTCGALFSTRTKFFDHLDRQLGSVAGKRYQCSHCNRTFAAERLLRDHMRNHVNQYKCPFCDMTSPFPANLRVHIKYRHTDEKPFKCELCDYSGKVMADLRKHSEIHNESQQYQCQVDGCTYTARAYQSLANHFKKSHQSDGQPSYQCHLCTSRLMRGSLLTKHLKKQHTFTWPSGHSRFRYKLHADGLFRLQTVRYESADVHGEGLADDVADDETSPEASDGAGESAADLLLERGDGVEQKANIDPRDTEGFEGSVYVDNAAEEFLTSLQEAVDRSQLKNGGEGDEQAQKEGVKETEEEVIEMETEFKVSVEISGSSVRSELLKKKRKASEHDLQEGDNPHQPKRNKTHDDFKNNKRDFDEKSNGNKSSKHQKSNRQPKCVKVEKENTPAAMNEVTIREQQSENWTGNTLEDLVADDAEEEGVTIQIVKNKDGQYVVRTEDSISALPKDIKMSDEDSGEYNLQMLGDVALQNI